MIHKALFSLIILSSIRAYTQSPQSRIESLERGQSTLSKETLTSIRYLFNTAERIEARGFHSQAERWREQANNYLDHAEDNRDPYVLARGKIVNRGYRSVCSPALQGYAIYIPPDYDPSRRYPLYVALHGGSSNGNLFLGVVLGNNMDWQTYNQHLFDEFTPRWTPDSIVVAPTGFGQIMWRWMGERDVLDVIDDVQKHYSIDPNRIMLGGISNGGVGAYTIGMRHAWRFSLVQAMAGAPSWVQYVGGRPTPIEQLELERYSGLHLAQNSINTTFHYYHGRTDPGPMRPAYINAFSQHLDELEIPNHQTWYDAGHDILYRVHRHGRAFASLREHERNPSPSEVHLTTGDYRANRQHWVRITRIADFPQRADLHAKIENSALSITTERVGAFSIDLRDAPITESMRIVIDEAQVYRGQTRDLGHLIHFVKKDTGWQLGFPSDEGLQKRLGTSGPISDAYYDRMVHVYGTQNPEHIETLQRAARRGARGWPLWAWNLNQEIIADTEVDDSYIQNAHLVLYGSPHDNVLLQRINGALPIRVAGNAVVVGNERYEGNDIGVRFVYPNPLAPHRYVIVQSGVTPSVVSAGNKLPEFVADYIVYDSRTVRGQQRRITGPNRALAMGFFSETWQLSETETETSTDGSGPDQQPLTTELEEEQEPTLPIPPAPPVPTAPARHRASSQDQAGQAVRRIWARVPRFENYRAQIPGATWRIERRMAWSVQNQQECYDALTEKGVPFRPRPEPSGIVPSPVEILGAVDGIWFRMTHEEDPLIMSCEMALRLPTLVEVLKEQNIHGIEILSSYRTTPFTSFHTMGLALDLSRFWTDEGWLSVLRHYEETPMQKTCQGPPPRARRARTLRRIACQLAASRRFSSILTPNYNIGHRDHFHIDARPNDSRLFVR